MLILLHLGKMTDAGRNLAECMVLISMAGSRGRLLLFLAFSIFWKCFWAWVLQSRPYIFAKVAGGGGRRGRYQGVGGGQRTSRTACTKLAFDIFPCFHVCNSLFTGLNERALCFTSVGEIQTRFFAVTYVCTRSKTLVSWFQLLVFFFLSNIDFVLGSCLFQLKVACLSLSGLWTMTTPGRNTLDDDNLTGKK